ncbi:4'-phosphopantetheinyl transferase [Pasteurella langaaensis DSM 22999]|uniref:4'-phosphopantetheinyl transferase n=1 Tax=Alitibacter langaaensis DSM 22999 TaxID=1122935 RepID=A0A2U0TH88_9PAST|nr:4'-phosphopantetheinyl transferase superfamily protein [Pasteurella langaaensis]PVX42973.1 4'-phosphopantetheinyl transferase [Pasteurella langaaensis DSM 22999]
MACFIAWGNTHQPYSFADIPVEFLTQKLRAEPTGNARVLQRHQCRQLVHFLLWQLCKIAQIPTALLAQIYRTESGRPQFPVEHIDFNIAHSDDWVAVILNVNEQGSRAETAVGIDIEFPKRTRNFTALLTHFAAENELSWFAQQSNPETSFYRIWCLREAVLKSQGVGIVKLSEVMHDPERLRLSSDYCPAGQLFFSDELPFYLAAFAAGDALENVQCFHWKEKQLCSISLKSAVKYQVNF